MIVSSAFPGVILENPVGDSYKIIKYVDKVKIVYQSNHSEINVSLEDLYDTYKNFRGRSISSTDLIAHAPGVFDSGRGGDAYNCTFFFMLLKAAGIIDKIENQINHEFFRAYIPL
jgi:hypothetical protein